MNKKVDQKRARQELAGIPDSKPFVQPGDCGEARLLKCHLNGVPISKLGLEAHVLAALDYWATDEGVRERNAQPQMREPSGVSLGKDPFAKSLDEKRDDVKDRDMALYEARDPFREVADRYAKPGMSPKFLSATRVKERAGTGDYEIVKDASGDPVKVRGMILGHMPTDVRNARNKHYRERGNKMLKQIDENFRNEVGPAAVSDQEK